MSYRWGEGSAERIANRILPFGWPIVPILELEKHSTTVPVFVDRQDLDALIQHGWDNVTSNLAIGMYISNFLISGLHASIFSLDDASMAH